MQVEGGLETEVVDVGEELLRIREKLLLPSVASPTYRLPELVLRSVPPDEGIGLVPVHIDNHHVHRNAHRTYLLAEVDKLEIGVLPIAAPPVTEHIFRRQRNASRYLRVVRKRRLVIVAVGEYVQILTFAFRACRHPVLPVRLARLEELARTFVDYRPAVAGEDSLLPRVVFGIDMVASGRPVEGSGRAEQVAAVVGSRGPGFLCAGQSETHAQVLVREFSAPGVSQRKVVCLDSHFLPFLCDFEGRHVQFAVYNRKTCAVFKAAVLAPLHPDQAGSEHGETGVALGYNGSGIRHGVPSFARRLGVCSQRKSQKCHN